MKGPHMANEKLVKVERSRGRINLGKMVPGLEPGALFQVTVEPGGVIILTPVRAVPLKDLDTKAA